MVGAVQDEAVEPAENLAPLPEFDCKPLSQKVFLDVDLWSQTVKGNTEIQIAPGSAELKTIKLNCRQMRIDRVTIASRAVGSMSYLDPYSLASMPWVSDVYQYHMLEDRIHNYVKLSPDSELSITLPKALKILEANDGGNGFAGSTADSAPNSKATTDYHRYVPLQLYIEFTIDDSRDGLHFVGCDEADLRFPHVYTSKLSPRSTCCIFPCFDDMDKRCDWNLSFRTARTVADAVSAAQPGTLSNGATDHLKNGTGTTVELSEQDRAMDLKVICSGSLTDEVVDSSDITKKTTSFIIEQSVTAHHVGFAIGAFQTVDLSKFRESNEEDRLGKSATPVYGFCLPGRASEVDNTCFPMAKAVDFLLSEYMGYPFSGYSFKLCFVDDMVVDRIDTATMSIVSNRMLFPSDVVDTMDHVTRELLYGLTCQWSGINITPKEPTDIWATIGIAYFMADSFLKHLAGKNEHLFNHCKAAEKVVDMDVGRPSIAESGRYLATDPSHLELINAKAPLVLYILDRRLNKSSGMAGMSRIIYRVFSNFGSNFGADNYGTLSTAEFLKISERIGHLKLDTFFNQWVFCAGCPKFRVSQRFNKKRLVVELSVVQEQTDQGDEANLRSDTFMRDVKEHNNEIYEGDAPAAFTGPMTIRIHEADGTPYEHIVEIKKVIERFDIPYNTKYKRLKRTRKQREKVAAGLTQDQNVDGAEDSLLYCLGDVLQSPEEETAWRLTNWSKEDEERMSSESYEWIRMDTDFEWICRLRISMPGYMFVSQLQQDRDVNAQYSTIQYLAQQKANPLVSTFLVRTLVDTRYFHAIRSSAALALINQAKDETDFAGLHHLLTSFHFLFSPADPNLNSVNDFSDRAGYYVRCSIIKAIGNVRNKSGRSPIAARKFLYEQLRGNDNSDNEVSDCNYVALLMRSLAEACSSAPMPDDDNMMVDLEDGDDWRFQRACAEELDRHRRADEWIPSYHNVLSESALDCIGMLAKTKIIPRSPLEFVQYSRDGTNEVLRLAAFRNLMHLGFLREDYILRWFMFVLGNDSSPYIRFNVLRLFGEWLGSVAIGQDYHAMQLQQQPRQENESSLVVEHDSTTESRKADIERKSSIPGAKAALQTILSTNETLQESIWQAIKSSSTSIMEISDLVTVCGLLYEPHTSMTIKLTYPKYYKAINKGHIPAGNGMKKKHLVSFVPTRPRMTMLPKKLDLKSRIPTAPVPERRDSGNRPLLTLKLKKPGQTKSMATPNTTAGGGLATSPSDVVTPGEEGKPRLKLKLKLPGAGSPPANG